jgi:replicative DNA helicase
MIDPILMPPIRNVASQMAVIGSMLLNGEEVIEQATAALRGEHFSDPDCRDVFSAIKLLYSQTGQFVAKSDVESHFEAKGIPIAHKLIEMARSVTANVSHHIEILHDDLLRFEIRRLSLDIASRVHDHSLTGRSLVTEAFSASDKLLRDGLIDRRKTLAQVLDTVASPDFHKPPIRSGFYDIDDFVGGFYPGELTVIGARPSMGKTAFLGNVAVNVSTAGTGTIIMSHEMTAEAIGMRLLCARANVPYRDKAENRLTPEQQAKLEAAAKEMGQLPVVFDDSTAPTIGYIKNTVRRYVRETGSKIVLLDYLTKVHSDSKGDTRERDVAEVSSGLKDLARDLDVAVVVFSQLSRMSLQRAEGRPSISDLRDSGQIEQDADMIILMHRPGEGKRTKSGADGATHTEFIIGKCRNGRTGIVELFFHGPSMSFRNAVNEKFMPISREYVPQTGDTPF